MCNNMNSHTKYNNPDVFQLDNLMNCLIERNENRLSEELWFAILSLRLKLNEFINKIVYDWKSSERVTGKKYTSFLKIIKWDGYEVFRDIFIEFLNYNSYYINDYSFEVHGEVYLRLSYEKLRPLNYKESKDEFTRNVSDELCRDSTKILKEYTVNCYLGIVLGNSSSSRKFPRYEILLFHDSGFPDDVCNIIENVTKFYFSKKRLSLTKTNKNGLLKINYIRNKLNHVPDIFLEEINRKLEVLIHTPDESFNNIYEDGSLITRKYLVELCYKVTSDYISVLKNEDYKRFNEMISVIKRKEQICFNCEAMCPCCGKKEEIELKY